MRNKILLVAILISLFLILPSVALAQETSTPVQTVTVERTIDWNSIIIYLGSLVLIFIVTALKHQSGEKAIESVAKMLPDDFTEKTLLPVIKAIIKEVLGNQSAFVELVDDGDDDEGMSYSKN